MRVYINALWCKSFSIIIIICSFDLFFFLYIFGSVSMCFCVLFAVCIYFYMLLSVFIKMFAILALSAPLILSNSVRNLQRHQHINTKILSQHKLVALRCSINTFPYKKKFRSSSSQHGFYVLSCLFLYSFFQWLSLKCFEHWTISRSSAVWAFSIFFACFLFPFLLFSTIYIANLF